MFSEASPDIVHFSLQINDDYDKTRILNPEQYCPINPENLVPLSDILPVVNDKWKNLQYFSLSGLLVRHEELFSVLASLPPSIRSVELSYLEFVEDRYHNYHDVLFGIRDTLDWAQRVESERPSLKLHTRSGALDRVSYYCYDDAAYNFIYHGGPDPFERPPISGNSASFTGQVHFVWLGLSTPAQECRFQKPQNRRL